MLLSGRRRGEQLEGESPARADIPRRKGGRGAGEVENVRGARTTLAGTTRWAHEPTVGSARF